jgi:hypothetical protein
VILWLFEREDRESRNVQLVFMEAVHLAGDHLPLHVEHGRRQCEVEERLLTIAQRVEAPLASVRALLEDHRDLVDHVVEPATDQAEAGFRVDAVIMQRRPSRLQRRADGRDRCLALESRG